MSKNFLINQKGQGLMEYMIISCLVGIFCLGMMGEYGKSIKNNIWSHRHDQ